MSSPTPPNGSIRTAAIMLLFRDGFHVDDLAEIFTLSNFNIEEHLRLAMFNGHVNPVTQPGSAAPSLSESTAPKKNRRQPKAKTSASNSCEKHPNGETGSKGRCKACSREYAKNYYLKQQKKRAQNSESEEDEPVSTKSSTKSPRGPKTRLTQAEVNRLAAPRPETEELPVQQLGNESAGEMEDVFQKIATRSSAEAVPPEADTTQGKTYSHLIHCPKCGQRHRFWKRANADDSRDHWISMACNNSLKISHYQIKTDRNYRGEAA